MSWNDAAEGDAARRRWKAAGIVPDAILETTLLTLQPGQERPLDAHPHRKKTLFALAGEASLWVDGQTVMLTPGEHYTVPPGVRHALHSLGGAVLEEVFTREAFGD